MVSDVLSLSLTLRKKENNNNFNFVSYSEITSFHLVLILIFWLCIAMDWNQAAVLFDGPHPINRT